MRKFPEEVIKALLQKRQIMLVNKIDDETREMVSAQIIYLNSLSSDLITLFIDSPGGETGAEMQLMDMISLSKAPVCGIVIGNGFSAAFDILQACRIRKSYPHSKMLFHAPRVNGIPVDDEEKMAREVDDAKSMHEELIGFISKRTGQPKEKWVEWSKKDRKFTAGEALELHMIDEIVSPVPFPDYNKK